jgi:hypothetical protein
MADLLRQAGGGDTRRGNAQLRRAIAKKHQADADFLSAAGTKHWPTAAALGRKFSDRLEDEFQAARRKRTAGGRYPVNDNDYGSSIRTVSGGLPTLGRHYH